MYAIVRLFLTQEAYGIIIRSVDYVNFLSWFSHECLRPIFNCTRLHAKRQTVCYGRKQKYFNKFRCGLCKTFDFKG